MITVTKKLNIGNTFAGALATAFNLKTTKGVKVNHLTSTVGMVEVNGVDYDFVINGSEVRFMEAK